MPALPPYIPRPQADFSAWANRLARLVAECPEKFALSPAEAAKITAMVEHWNAAYRLATAPWTKTKCTVQTKNEVLRDTLDVLRGYAQRIARAAEVSEGDKKAVGVNPGTSKWTRIAVPTSHPVLAVKEALCQRLTLKYFDSESIKHAVAKPHGVGSCQIFYALRPLSAPPITNRAELVTQVTATRSPVILDFAIGGEQCYLSAYWLMRNAKRGPWGPITSFTVPRG
jgi:hypothetical protein